MLIIVPLSLTENQWVITLPQGGQPIPLNHPTRKLRIPITSIASALCSAPIHWIGTIIKHIESAVRTSPRGRNTRALERSLTLPIRNLERAYAAALSPSTNPNSLFSNPSGAIEGIAIERFLRTR